MWAFKKQVYKTIDKFIQNFIQYIILHAKIELTKIRYSYSIYDQIFLQSNTAISVFSEIFIFNLISRLYAKIELTKIRSGN